MQTQLIFDFDTQSDINNWRVVDDVVMGGRSAGSFTIDENGHGVFKGNVSLENNGGFSSLRYRFKKINTTGYTKAVLRVKGDGKSYQFRVKANASDYHSYTGKFNTTNKWETIEIHLKEMYPAFRGRTLDIGNYDSDSIQEIAFLIGNKKAENFMLEIDFVRLE
ncbi:CIA30 family protein [Croceitalea rosinachiae]|uniref:CIA30 family protein n=1 Tax=Croceitalea rosinachiae TaxID=3075596 RepID=A0ABU3A8N2_9FLAO|nr:CIA30 family protein [Croceitalea sp. F388]MDT0606314.1 CIA30 family protein [Croceitalea sp. F388]